MSTFKTVEQMQAEIASQAEQIEQLREALTTIGNAAIPAFVASKGNTYADQVHSHHTGLRDEARAALQAGEG